MAKLSFIEKEIFEKILNREGLLFDAADKNIRKFNIAASAPKDNKTGKTKKLAEWTLSHLINVAHEVGVISLDVKEYGQKLINFRNYIHPLEQLRQNLTLIYIREELVGMYSKRLSVT